MINHFPAEPVSIAIVAKETDVFLSFHFEAADTPNAHYLAGMLGDWLTVFLKQHGIEAQRLDLSGNYES